MSLPQPPTRPPTSSETEQYRTLIRNASWALLIACPLVMALPPRKLNIPTLGLGITWLASADHITYEKTHKSIWQHISPFSAANQMPTEKAREYQRAMREKREAEEAAETIEKERTLVQKVWMGGEKEDWRRRRAEEDRRKIAEGQGFGSMIMEQIWEVVTWGKGGKEEEGGEGTEGK
ncbi:hypothetical protein LTS18_013433 [Coniosporium uncinatum]|uniref:Uncharacterized protein n=1 Tax=Coniosporium uncinatum TaxID=93489 RepID=A0ACC3DW12_9PEZI|nr:hypothetical protein LTS18_013433 [Coniosporium uncinatum]